MVWSILPQRTAFSPCITALKSWWLTLFWSHLCQCSFCNICGSCSKCFACVGLCTVLIWMVKCWQRSSLLHIHVTVTAAVDVLCCGAVWCAQMKQLSWQRAKQFSPVKIKVQSLNCTATVPNVWDGGWELDLWEMLTSQKSLFQRSCCSSVRLNACCKSLLCFPICVWLSAIHPWQMMVYLYIGTVLESCKCRGTVRRASEHSSTAGYGRERSALLSKGLPFLLGCQLAEITTTFFSGVISVFVLQLTHQPSQGIHSPVITAVWFAH